jgi:hypothetical protein
MMEPQRQGLTERSHRSFMVSAAVEMAMNRRTIAIDMGGT